VVVWDSLDDLQKINGHPGTSFVFDNNFICSHKIDMNTNV